MAQGVTRLLKVSSSFYLSLTCILLLIYCYENSPSFAVKGSQLGKFITKSGKYLNFSTKLKGENILYLPSYNIIKPDVRYSNSFMSVISEYVYMYLQTKQSNNILNGCASFYSPQRLRLNDAINEFNNTGNSIALTDSFKFTYLVYYKHNPFNYINYDHRINDLFTNDCLQMIYEDSLQIAFKKIK